jgi:aminoglycoside phosphotransferase (APT) family kinase protein
MYSFYGTFASECDKKTEAFILRLYKKEEDAEKGRKEFAILNALKAQNLPVPTVYCFEENCEVLGKPFMIMQRIMAKDISHYLNDEKNAQAIVEKMAKCLVKIHNADISYIKNSNILRQHYELKQQRLLETRFFINTHCMRFLGFSPLPQRRFIAAVKKLGFVEPKKVCSTLLHLDYEPNHILELDGQFIVIDWGEAGIGDPASDVAWTYHKLRLERENAKVDLGEYFVKCYEKYSGQKLVNLQFFKDNAAIDMAEWSGLSPFCASSFQNYARLMSLFFGDIVGEVIRTRDISKLQKYMEGHHTSVWTNIRYIQSYALRYLERDRYETMN